MYRSSSRWSEIGDFLTFDGHREQNTGSGETRKNFISFRSTNIQMQKLTSSMKNICLRKEENSSVPSEIKARKLSRRFFRLSVSRTSKINVKFSTTEKFVKTERSTYFLFIFSAKSFWKSHFTWNCKVKSKQILWLRFLSKIPTNFANFELRKNGGVFWRFEQDCHGYAKRFDLRNLWNYSKTWKNAMVSMFEAPSNLPGLPKQKRKVFLWWTDFQRTLQDHRKIVEH